jgi:hypothetical protein
MVDMPSGLRISVLAALKVHFIVLAIDMAFVLIWMMLFDAVVLAPLRADFFSFLLLLEAGIVFLVGGAIAMSSSIFPSKIREHFLHSGEKWSEEKLKKGEARANTYILAGVFLFLESVGFAFLV